MTNRDDFWSLSDDESDNDCEHYVYRASICGHTLHLHLYLTEVTDKSVDWIVWTNTTGTVGMDGSLLEPHGGSHGYASDKASALRDTEQTARRMIATVESGIV